MIALPNHHAPVDAVYVCIDPGTDKSGVCIGLRDKLLSVSCVRGLDPKAMEAVFVGAEIIAAAAGGVPVVCVIEKPPPATVLYRGKAGGKRGVVGISGVNRAIGSWKHEARRAEAKVVDMHLSTWRSRALPSGMRRGSAIIVRAEEFVSAGVAKSHGLSLEGLPHDSRVALLIARVSMLAPEVRAVAEGVALSVARAAERERRKLEPRHRRKKKPVAIVAHGVAFGIDFGHGPSSAILVTPPPKGTP